MHFIAITSPISHLLNNYISFFFFSPQKYPRLLFVFINTRFSVIWRLLSRTCFPTSRLKLVWQHFPCTRVALGLCRCHFLAEESDAKTVFSSSHWIMYFSPKCKYEMVGLIKAQLCFQEKKRCFPSSVMDTVAIFLKLSQDTVKHF